MEDSKLFNIHEVKPKKEGVSKATGKPYTAQEAVATDNEGKKLSLSFLNMDGTEYSGKQVRAYRIQPKTGQYGEQWTILSTTTIEVVGNAEGAAPAAKKPYVGNGYGAPRVPLSMSDAQRITDFVLEKYKDVYADDRASSDFCSKIIATYLASGVKPDLSEMSKITKKDLVKAANNGQDKLDVQKARLAEIMGRDE